MSWIEDWKPGTAALLWGGVGNGKTSSVRALAAELRFDLLEVNASDQRNATAMKEIVGRASRSKSLGKRGKIILVDEVDALSGTQDRGAVAELVKIIEKSLCPIVLTATDAYHPKLRGLLRLCKLIKFGRVHLLAMIKRLKFICQQEGVEADEEILRRIARQTGGDLRAAILDLQSIAFGKRKISLADIEAISHRETKQDIFETLKVIFKTQDVRTAIEVLRAADKDPDEIFWWLEQNLPTEYKGEELARALDWLSRADMFNARVRIRQRWRMRMYANELMAAGVATAKREPYMHFVSYKPPARLMRYGRVKISRALMLELCKKLSKELHTSSKIVIDCYLPLLRIIFAKKQKWRKNIIDYFDLDEREVSMLEG
jgi:replication factor C large subunit